MNKPLTTTVFPLVASAISIALILAAALVFNVQNYPFLLQEGGLIESLSAAGYFVCALFIAWVGRWSYVKQYPYFLTLIVMFGLRELDFDKKFTTMGIFKSRFYLTDSVPLGEKVVGFLFIVLILSIIFAIFKNHLKGFFCKVMQKSPVHIGALMVFAVLVFTKSIDGIGRKLGDIGIALPDTASTTFEVIEEVLEMGIPLFIFATYLIYFAIKKLEAASKA